MAQNQPKWFKRAQQADKCWAWLWESLSKVDNVQARDLLSLWTPRQEFSASTIICPLSREVKEALSLIPEEADLIPVSNEEAKANFRIDIGKRIQTIPLLPHTVYRRARANEAIEAAVKLQVQDDVYYREEEGEFKVFPQPLFLQSTGLKRPGLSLQMVPPVEGEGLCVEAIKRDIFDKMSRAERLRLRNDNRVLFAFYSLDSSSVNNVDSPTFRIENDFDKHATLSVQADNGVEAIENEEGKDGFLMDGTIDLNWERTEMVYVFKARADWSLLHSWDDEETMKVIAEALNHILSHDVSLYSVVEGIYTDLGNPDRIALLERINDVLHSHLCQTSCRDDDHNIISIAIHEVMVVKKHIEDVTLFLYGSTVPSITATEQAANDMI